VARDEPQVNIGGLLEQVFLGFKRIMDQRKQCALEKKKDKRVTKDKGSNTPRNKEVKARMNTNCMEGSWNVGTWSQLRVRVLES
jgi:hypothetical protein